MDPAPQLIPALVSSFPAPEYSLDGESMRQAIGDRTMFSLFHVAEGDKVDFWLLTDDPFDVMRFSRRSSQEVLGTRVFVSSPEDTILAKLRWAKLSGGSEKQLHDALGVYEVQRASLDMEYLKRWVKTLHIKEYWDRLLQESAP